MESISTPVRKHYLETQLIQPENTWLESPPKQFMSKLPSRGGSCSNVFQYVAILLFQVELTWFCHVLPISTAPIAFFLRLWEVDDLDWCRSGCDERCSGTPQFACEPEASMKGYKQHLGSMGWRTYSSNKSGQSIEHMKATIENIQSLRRLILQSLLDNTF